MCNWNYTNGIWKLRDQYQCTGKKKILRATYWTLFTIDLNKMWQNNWMSSLFNCRARSLNLYLIRKIQSETNRTSPIGNNLPLSTANLYSRCMYINLILCGFGIHIYIFNAHSLCHRVDSISIIGLVNSHDNNIFAVHQTHRPIEAENNFFCFKDFHLLYRRWWVLTNRQSDYEQTDVSESHIIGCLAFDGVHPLRAHSNGNSSRWANKYLGGWSPNTWLLLQFQPLKLVRKRVSFFHQKHLK